MGKESPQSVPTNVAAELSNLEAELHATDSIAHQLRCIEDRIEMARSLVHQHPNHAHSKLLLWSLSCEKTFYRALSESRRAVEANKPLGDRLKPWLDAHVRLQRDFPSLAYARTIAERIDHAMQRVVAETSADAFQFRDMLSPAQAARALQDIAPSIAKLRNRFSLSKDALAIIVDPRAQRLYLLRGDTLIQSYPISTGKRGIGNRPKTQQTPHGTHVIAGKTGYGAVSGTILRSTLSTHRVASVSQETENLPPAYVTSRALLLEGKEYGVNRGGDEDTRERNIYIHGTSQEGLLGRPASSGCIRMSNRDIIELFHIVPAMTFVEIQDEPFDRYAAKEVAFAREPLPQ